MANFAETSSFDTVHELGITEPVLGGPGGNSNVPLQQLVNRTKFLLDAVEALESGGGPFALDASGGALPTTGSGPGPGFAIKRKDLYNVTVAGTISGTPLQVGDQLIAKIDNAAVISDYIILQAGVDLATDTILGLVKLAQNISGGAAADKTLSITGLLAIFAQLASPALTGNPTAPTQAPGTNNTRIATTKYADDAVAVETAARASADSGKVAKSGDSMAGLLTLNAGLNVAGGNAYGANAPTDPSHFTRKDYVDASVGNEATNRNNADVVIQASVGNEATNRNNADVVIQGQVTTLQNIAVVGRDGEKYEVVRIDIGAWNMDTTDAIVVDISALQPAQSGRLFLLGCVIYPDGTFGSINSQIANFLPSIDSNGDNQAWVDQGVNDHTLSGSLVTIRRRPGGTFDNSGFDAGGNRGRLFFGWKTS